ncbi:restriction endonuclease subunit S [Enterococcus sp. GC37]|uniref:restriction endonuclease subunit S n=1 Tax=unclassified Enterococcus TaxID=2608891 RepID=UPI0034A06A2E
MSNDTQPEIRFPGFTGDWEQRKLGDEFEKVNERNDGSFGKDKWISVAKMYFQDPEKVQSNNIDTRTYVMRLGDIAFEGHPNADFKFGRFVVNDIGEGVVSELFPIYRHKQEYDNNYWKYAIQLERIMAPIFAKSITSSGNSSNKLYPKHFLRQRVSVASIDEQHKIGDFLLTIDRTIALHQRKLDLLKETKKGFLQKMFPKNGAKVPEIRFPGFTEAWEQRKFFDNIKNTIDFRGRTPKKLGMDWSVSGYLALSALNVKNGYIDPSVDAHYGNQELYDKWMSGKELYKGQVLFTTEAPMGNVAQVPDNNKYILSQRTIAFELYSDKITDDFLAVLLRSPQSYNKLLSLASGGTAKGVSQKSLSQFIVTLPKDLDEQQKIGSFFKQLDDTIALHQRKLDLLKEMKKGFLQKMFV